MKRNRKKDRRREDTIRVYGLDEATKMLPYVRTVLRSLREAHVEARREEASARKMEQRHGRPTRDTLIYIDESRKAASRADDRCQDAIDDLSDLDVYVLDPVRGEALIPFAQEEQLAWYVYELHGDEKIRMWRFQSDPLEMRRPVNPDDGPVPQWTVSA